MLDSCPKVLPAELSAHIEAFACAWAVHDRRPSPAGPVLRSWDELLRTWIADEALPLFVRKAQNNRGVELVHESGRCLVPTDNSPAQWSYTLASAGICPSIDQVRTWIKEDAIPVTMIQKLTERAAAKYHCNLTKAHDVNRKGWKLAHIESVGLNTRRPLETVPLQQLAAQFLKFLSPSNMFVVPLEWAGIAEIDLVIKQMTKHMEGPLPS